jgi:hypothetical protein
LLGSEPRRDDTGIGSVGCYGIKVTGLRRYRQRRLKEDLNQHYRYLECAGWMDLRVTARFEEQPVACSLWYYAINAGGLKAENG